MEDIVVEGVVEIVEEATVSALGDQGEIVVVVDDDEVVKEVLIHNSFMQ